MGFLDSRILNVLIGGILLSLVKLMKTSEMWTMIKSVDCLFLFHQMPPEIPVRR